MAPINAVNALKGGFSGTVLLPSQPGYDEARSVFNGMIDRSPAVIARCADAADVAAAVDTARDNELLVAVRSGGHGVAGLATCDDGMMIDLSGLRSVTVDPVARTATAGGGVLWGSTTRPPRRRGCTPPAGG
ncbi:FAD-dependent oxidoreductase [Actinomadura madurae]|nr:FAD-binding protein [Actinomadura madurae]MCP9952375.1 FAD-dependent oxidoreductase [Actinomadura madurae]MCP9969143.1 FAD-dependent oxidoreductase [Actinomadura madurae]MCP9981616.1 FAD-dependent oxidoreductase [Actinomadura madurae]MCQ0006879.1 FAD-dependent oxidoreductase [Actinomadura madurae]MCQ0017815.1 FAD-dependent oxidoreductase [Actinomadura madurae]